jgi:hypothetical protein
MHGLGLAAHPVPPAGASDKLLNTSVLPKTPAPRGVATTVLPDGAVLKLGLIV